MCVRFTIKFELLIRGCTVALKKNVMVEHTDIFTARHDMLYDEEYDLQSAKKYLFAKKHAILA